MDTVRTTGDGEDYFLDGCKNYAIKKNTHLVTGHIHYERKTELFDNLKSAGYQRAIYDYYVGKKKIKVIADLHIGVPETEVNVDYVITQLEKQDYEYLVLLGDTFDLTLSSNKNITANKHFNRLEKLFGSVKTIFIQGNHDANLIPSRLSSVMYKLTKELDLRKYLITKHDVMITNYFELGDYGFIHGHQFDHNVKTFGKLYLLAFRWLDFINPTLSYVDKLLDITQWGKRM